MHVVTRWDLQSEALFAYNSFKPDSSERVAFVIFHAGACLLHRRSDRLIGRKSSLRDPAAMGTND